MKKVALITGGTRGIGLGIAQSLAKEGYRLVLCGVRDESAVSDTLQTLRDETGAEVLYVACDVSDGEARARLVDAIRSHYGALHVLVNNAGVAPSERADILDASEESFDRLIHINLRGPYFLTQAIARWMVEQSEDPDYSGTIINVCSISSTVASVNRGDYCISKAGLSMTTALWATRLAEHGIDVFEVRPGLIKTDMTSGVTSKYDQLIEDGLLLQARWGAPEDIGRTVSSLARGDLPYATGQVLVMDGGLTMQRL